MITYSGIIEIIGVRDLADIEPGTYTDKLKDFYRILENKLDNNDHDLKISGHRDYFFFKNEKVQILLDFINDLRWNLINELDDALLCRGVIMMGNYSLKSPRKRLLKKTGFKEFDRFTASLYGELENHKGIGIKIHPEVVRKMTKRQFTKYVMKNYYVEDFSNAIFDEFYDLKLKSNLKSTHLHKICTEFERSSNLSPKLGRYFIPFFNNVIYHWNYTSDSKYKELLKRLKDKKKKVVSRRTWIQESSRANGLKGLDRYSVENLLYTSYFNRFKAVVGIRIVYLFFLKKAMDEFLFQQTGNKKDRIGLSEMNYLMQVIKKNYWFMSFLKKDAIWISPNSLLDKASKRKLLMEIEKQV